MDFRRFHGMFLCFLLAAFLAAACSSSGDSGPGTDGDTERETDGDGETDGELPDSDGDSDDESASGGDRDAEADAPDFSPADRPGPHHAAAILHTFTDPERDRELPGIVWYPTDETEGPTVNYLLGLVSDTGVLDGAAPALAGPAPLVIFSHGHQAFDAQSYFLTEYLATHGYIVAACNHTDDTFTALGNEKLIQSAMDRPVDVSILIDTLLAWNAEEGHRFHGLVDPERIAVIGHSYGGYTAVASVGPSLDIPAFLDECREKGEDGWQGAYEFCDIFLDADATPAENCRPCSLGDARIKVSIPMSPAFEPLFSDNALRNVTVPMLLMAGSIDEVIPPDQVRLYFEHTPHGTLYWELSGATHYTFSNVCDLESLASIEKFRCGEQTIGKQRAFDLIATACTAFLGWRLLEDARYERYFEGDYLAATPEIALERHTK